VISLKVQKFVLPFNCSSALSSLKHKIWKRKTQHSILMSHIKTLNTNNFLLTTNKLHGDQSFSKKLPVTQLLKNSQHITEPKGSLLCSQEATTASCPEPHEFSPLHINFSKILPNINLSPISSSSVFFFVFFHQPHMNSSYPLCVLHFLLILYS
jgi:hypothetical protein